MKRTAKPTVTGVASGKGGVGKTLLAACMGTLLNEHLGLERHKVLLADLDFGVKGLTFLYASAGSWERSGSGCMIDVISRKEDPREIIQRANAFNRLVVVPAQIDFKRPISWDTYLPPFRNLAGSIGSFIDAAGEQGFEHIIFDTGAGLDQATVALSEHADTIIVVVEPDEISLTAAVDLRAELVSHREKLNLQFVVNKEPDNFPTKLQKMIKEKISFLPSIPLDQKLHARFVRDARRVASRGFSRTRYKRFVGLITNEIFGTAALTPTMLDRVLRKTAAKMFFRLVGYGIVFFLLVAVVVASISFWSG
ncbi:MAG: AAA family ATPase [Rhodospirillales bacterium]|nr:AAA family ATPase [Rhodospirillales bacterium]